MISRLILKIVTTDILLYAPYSIVATSEDSCQQDVINYEQPKLFCRSEDRGDIVKRCVKYGLIVAVIALCVSTMLSYRSDNKDTLKQQRCPLRQQKKLTKGDVGCHFVPTETPPNIFCLGLSLEKSLPDVLTALEEAKNQKHLEVKLSLTEIIFKNGMLQANWLPLTDKHAQVIALSFEMGNLKMIGDNSFNTMPTLRSLTFEQTNLKTFNKKGIKGLTNLREFNLLSNTKLTTVDFGLLQGTYVTTLQIQSLPQLSIDAVHQFFDNLTGQMDLPFVSILDLERSSLPIFPSNLLTRLPDLQSLYLEYGEIEVFEPGSFKKSFNLRQVFLENNAISTLKEEIFGDLIRNNVSLYANHNPFLCDCEMYWIQQYIINERKRNYTDFGSIVCSNPEQLVGKMFLDVDLCSETTSTMPEETSSTVVPTTTVRSTTQPVITDKVCSILTASNFTTSINLNSKPRFYVTSEKRGVVDFTISPIKSSRHFSFYIYAMSNTREIICQLVTTSNFSVSNVTTNTDMIFCLFDADIILSGETHNFNCIPYRTEEELSQKAWLTMGAKTPALLGFSFLIIFVLLLGIAATYCLIRSRPTLLKGSDRVEIVKTRDKQMVLVMPDSINSGPSSPNSVYDTISGYITAPPSEAKSFRINPPPVPPYPSHWLRQNKKEEHVYLEPCNHMGGSLPGNVDILLEYEWYTQRSQKQPAAT